MNTLREFHEAMKELGMIYKTCFILNRLGLFFENDEHEIKT